MLLHRAKERRTSAMNLLLRNDGETNCAQRMYSARHGSAAVGHQLGQYYGASRLRERRRAPICFNMRSAPDSSESLPAASLKRAELRTCFTAQPMRYELRAVEVTAPCACSRLIASDVTLDHVTAELRIVLARMFAAHPPCETMSQCACDQRMNC